MGQYRPDCRHAAGCVYTFFVLNIRQYYRNVYYKTPDDPSSGHAFKFDICEIYITTPPDGLGLWPAQLYIYKSLLFLPCKNGQVVGERKSHLKESAARSNVYTNTPGDFPFSFSFWAWERERKTEQGFLVRLSFLPSSSAWRLCNIPKSRK